MVHNSVGNHMRRGERDNFDNRERRRKNQHRYHSLFNLFQVRRFYEITHNFFFFFELIFLPLTSNHTCIAFLINNLSKIYLYLLAGERDGETFSIRKEIAMKTTKKREVKRDQSKPSMCSGKREKDKDKERKKE